MKDGGPVIVQEERVTSDTVSSSKFEFASLLLHPPNDQHQTTMYQTSVTQKLSVNASAAPLYEENKFEEVKSMCSDTQSPPKAHPKHIVCSNQRLHSPRKRKVAHTPWVLANHRSIKGLTTLQASTKT